MPKVFTPKTVYTYDLDELKRMVVLDLELFNGTTVLPEDVIVEYSGGHKTCDCESWGEYDCNHEREPKVFTGFKITAN